MSDPAETPIDLTGAVNALLDAIGQAPVTAVTGAIQVDARKALNQIQQTTRTIQHRAWHFNSEEDLSLAISSDGSVALPENMVRVSPGAYDRVWRDYVPRGQPPLLYDRQGHTFSFLTPPRVDIVYAFPFEQLPDPARWYVTCLAGRRFVGPQLASQAAFRFSDVEVQEALRLLEEHDRETRGSLTMKEVNPHFSRFQRGR